MNILISMRNIGIVSILALGLIGWPAFGAHNKPAKAVQMNVTLGLYVTSIYDINLEQNYYGVEFWVWHIYRKEYARRYGFNPLNTIRLLDIYDNQYVENFIKIDSTLKNDIYVLKKVSAKIRNDFDVRYFPFDKQTLHLKFEDAEHEKRVMLFEIDGHPYSKSGIDDRISIDGVKINPLLTLTHEAHKYQNNFGNPRTLKNKDDFDRVVATITIERSVGFLFIKIFLGLYISYLIAVVSFFVSPRDISTRFSLPVGGIFAAVGNKYFVDGLLPKVNSITLADYLHSTAFFFIFLIVLISVINIYVIRADNEQHRLQHIRAFDMKAFVYLNLSFLLVNVGFIVVSSLG